MRIGHAGVVPLNAFARTAAPSRSKNSACHTSGPVYCARGPSSPHGYIDCTKRSGSSTHAASSSARRWVACDVFTGDGKGILRGAEQGDADGQVNLGAMYSQGRGVPNDDAEAVRWFRLAADQGDADAQNTLGRLCGLGQGVPQDDEEGVNWFRRAAEQGNADAQYRLGVMCANGRGVLQDDVEAVGWYRRAAEQGHSGAEVNLGWMYEQGLGVPQDDVEAVKWFRRAAEQGNADGQKNLGVSFAKGVGVEQDYVIAYMWLDLGARQREDVAAARDHVAAQMTRKQRAEAQRLAKKWNSGVRRFH